MLARRERQAGALAVHLAHRLVLDEGVRADGVLEAEVGLLLVVRRGEPLVRRAVHEAHHRVDGHRLALRAEARADVGGLNHPRRLVRDGGALGELEHVHVLLREQLRPQVDERGARRREVAARAERRREGERELLAVAERAVVGGGGGGGVGAEGERAARRRADRAGVGEDLVAVRLAGEELAERDAQRAAAARRAEGDGGAEGDVGGGGAQRRRRELRVALRLLLEQVEAPLRLRLEEVLHPQRLELVVLAPVAEADAERVLRRALQLLRREERLDGEGHRRRGGEERRLRKFVTVTAASRTGPVGAGKAAPALSVALAAAWPAARREAGGRGGGGEQQKTRQ